MKLALHEIRNQWKSDKIKIEIKQKFKKQNEIKEKNW